MIFVFLVVKALVVGAGQRDLRMGSRRERQFLIFVLQLIQLPVNAALGQQLLVRPISRRRPL